MAYSSSTGVYTPRPQYYQMQTFKYVTPGSIRVGTDHSNSDLMLYAFRHPTTGRVTLVGRNPSASPITINGSLNGVGTVDALQFYSTGVNDNFESFTRGSDAVVTNGSFAVAVPPDSFFTLTSAAH
jgi:hypothetical protein